MFKIQTNNDPHKKIYTHADHTVQIHPIETSDEYDLCGIKHNPHTQFKILNWD